MLAAPAGAQHLHPAAVPPDCVAPGLTPDGPRKFAVSREKERCEGTYPVFRSPGAALQLSSFRLGPPTLKGWPTSNRVVLRWSQSGEMSVRAQLRQPEQYGFRMETRVQRSARFVWPLSTAKQWIAGPQDDLGVLVFREERIGQSLVTVVHPVEVADQDNSAAAGASYQVVLLSGASLMALTATLTPVGDQLTADKSCALAKGAIASEPPRLVGSEEEVTVEINRGALPCPGTYLITVGAKRADQGAPVVARVYFHHAG
jgi:hypothetical protein